jgi:hypothetical protein
MDPAPPEGGAEDGIRAGAALAELSLQPIPAPSVHDVVVTRRDDGTEVLREPAGVPLLAGELLGRIRDEMERLDRDTFLEGWSAKPRAS